MGYLNIKIYLLVYGVKREREREREREKSILVH